MESLELPKPTNWRLTRKRLRAALMVAKDELIDEQIAAQVGINKTTLEDWKRRPEFRERVNEHLESFRDKTLQEGIADRLNRVRALNDRQQRMVRLIEARAAEHAPSDEPSEHAAVPGGDTGMLVRSYKGVGRGDDFQLLEEYAFDAALAKEMREHEKQAAQELGQWLERIEQSGALEQKHVIDLSELSEEELRVLARIGLTSI